MDQHHTSTTDDTVLDLSTHPDPTTAFSASESPAAPNGGRRRTRRLVAAAAALAVLAGVATAVLAGGGSTDPTPRTAGAEVDLVSAGPEATLPPADPQGDPGGSPQADLPEAQPEPPAAPGVLAVDTPVLWLLAGDYDGSFTVRNDGGSPIDWTFEGGIGAIGVSQSEGTLAPGASTVVSFSINPFQLADGPFVFVNHIVGGGFDRTLTLHGTKTPIVVNPDIPQGPKNIKP